MELYIFDKQREPIGVIDTFESLIWKRSYQNIGSFELHIFLPQEDEDAFNLIELLKKDHYIMKGNDSEELGIIKIVELSDEDGEKIMVRGFLLDSIMARRIILGRIAFNGTAETMMKHVVYKNFIDTTPNRVYPNLVLSPSRGITTPASDINSYGVVASWLTEQSKLYEVGWRVLFDIETKDFVFDVYQGIDSSGSQTVNPQIIFSMDYENVLNQTFIQDVSDVKTTAIVAGSDEGVDRIIEMVGDNFVGEDRYELFVDAKDLQPEDDEGEPIPEATYREQLSVRGELKLAEYKPIATFESGISVLSNYVYREDYDLGYKVTIENRRWGVVLDTRITEISEIYEKNIVDENEIIVMDIEVVFGENVPTIIDKVRRVMR